MLVFLGEYDKIWKTYRFDLWVKVWCGVKDLVCKVDKR